MTQEKINIAELLKDCPQGMELDCTMIEGLEFDGIVDAYFSIRCRVKHPDGGYNVYNFTEYGCWTTDDFAKCVIFPKGKTTWEGFVPPCKFDITTLVPLDSRVLVRDCNCDEWEGDIFTRYDNKSFDNFFFVTLGGSSWKQCIPYEGNEHLLGTTNDCDEFYKTWG